MNVEVEVGDRARSVEARGSEVTVDGRRFHVDAARVGYRWSVILGPVDAENADRGGPRRSYEVAIAGRTPGDLTAYVNGCPVSVRLLSSGTGHRGFGARSLRDAGRAGVVGGPRRVVAPMPGRIARVLVKVGDVVAARQGLVVVEAMKMENELRSTHAGTVTEVPAVEGALVEVNAVLVVMDR